MSEYGELCLRGNEIPFPLLERTERAISDYTVSFVIDGEPRGSGTLVHISGCYGILTAHHVSKVLCKSQANSIGINIADFGHRFAVSASHLNHVVIGDSTGHAEDSGPDLAFLKILNPKTLSELKSRKSFLSLDNKTFDPYRDCPQNYLWFVAGAPAEFIKKLEIEGKPGPVICETHLIAFAEFISLSNLKEFDYVRLRLQAGERNFPKNYQGVSGGGIWLLPLTMNREKGIQSLTCDLPFLAGVAFYQSELKEAERTIIGHGPSSLYQSLSDALRVN